MSTDAPKTDTENTEKKPYGPHRCRAVGDYVLDVLSFAIKAESERKGSDLSVQETLRIIDSVRSTPEGVWSFYNKSFASCHDLSSATAPIGYHRQNLLMRLLAHPFENRLTNNPEEAHDSPLLVSRQALLPFDNAMEDMLGVGSLQEKRETCLTIVDDLQRIHGGEFMWPLYYQDTRAHAILLKTCAEIAPHFDDFEKRMQWFVNRLNSQSLIDGTAESFDFSHHDAVLLLTCLMEPCREPVSGEDSELLTGDERSALKALIDNLDGYALREALLASSS